VYQLHKLLKSSEAASSSDHQYQVMPPQPKLEVDSIFVSLVKGNTHCCKIWQNRKNAVYHGIEQNLNQEKENPSAY
jgi:hypothetical protein